MDNDDHSPTIKPVTPTGAIPVGSKDVDINTNVVPSSPLPEPNEIENKLNDAVKKDTFKPIDNNESTSDQ